MAHPAKGILKQRYAQPTPQPASTSKTDAFYGHEQMSRLCARFITHLFACPEHPPTSSNAQPLQASGKLPYFIAYALYRTKLHASVTFAALVLLQRLKARFPTARGSSGHRLFISAFMIASKVICDDTYSNKSWCIVAQNMFSLREINQMEREMCGYLEWELTVDSGILDGFEKMVKRDFLVSNGPYPTYSLSQVSRRAARAAAAAGSSSNAPTPMPPPNATTSPIPMFGNAHRSTPSEPSPTSSIPHSINTAVPPHLSSHSTSPSTPDTPSYSDTSSGTPSPASTSSPQTPSGFDDNSAKIVSASSSPCLSIRSEKVSMLNPLKTKMFAFAMPSIW
jgi:hypothetical protein